jgi:hypothetical protein
VVVSAIVVVLALEVGMVASGVDHNAVSQAAVYQPQAHWRVIDRSLEPWANDIVRGQARYSGGSGPAWVVELAAPGDSRYLRYSGMVVINAITGKVENINVLASS